MISYKPLLDKRAGFIIERNKLSDAAVGEGRSLSKDEQGEYKRLTGEIERMDQLIQTARTMDGGNQQDLGAPVEGAAGYAERGQRGNFAPSGYTTEHRSLAAFVNDVRFGERRDMSMGVGSAGGFLIPDQLLPGVIMVDPEVASITARATTIGPNQGAPDAATEIPVLDVSGAHGVYGGVTMAWIGEAATKPQTEPELAMVKLEPNEIAGHIVVSDKLLRNGGNEFSTFLSRVLRGALSAAQEQAFINGTGLGQPLGILGHPACINVPRTGPGGIVYADLVAMIAAFGPNTWSRGFWMCSQSALPALLTMADPGAGGTLIIRPSEVQQGKPISLLGLPLIVSTRTPVLGTQGDLMLLEASYYLRKLGSGPFIAASEHPRFTRNQSIIKIWANVDGQPWMTTPVLAEDGLTQLSPFVVLQ